MLAALAVIIPLGLGGAVSPVMLTEQTVLLAGPDGGSAGVRYAAGVVLTTLVIVVAIERFGRAISLPTEPHLDATLDVVLGLVLVNVAVLVLVFSRCGNAPNEAAVLGISRCAGAWSGELDVDHASNAANEAWPVRGVAADGSHRMAPGMIKPYQPPVAQEVLVNVTDHDSRVVRTHGQPPLQGYNAHMAVNEQQHAAPGESFGGRRRPVWRRGSPASMSVAVTRVG